MTLTSLVKVYSEINEYSKALPLFNKALDIQRNLFGDNHPDVALTLNNMAELYSEIQNYSKAEDLYKKALEINLRFFGKNHIEVARGLSNLALLYGKMDRHSEAFSLLENTMIIEDEIIKRIFSMTSERQRLNLFALIKGTLYCLLSLVLQHFTNSDNEIRIVMDLILHRKGIILETLSAQREIILSGRYPELKDKLQEFNKIRRLLSSAMLSISPDKQIMKDQQQILSYWLIKEEALEREIVSKIPITGLNDRLLTMANTTSVSNSLKDGEILIEFVQSYNIYNSKITPSHYVAFILMKSNQNPIKMVDLGECSYIDNLIKDLLFIIIEAKDADIATSYPSASNERIIKIRNKGKNLRIAIFDRLIPLLRNHKRLFISPDGYINMLPFEILPTTDNEDNRYLIDDYCISYLSSVEI